LILPLINAALLTIYWLHIILLNSPTSHHCGHS
jgi:hypothetical protein